MLSVTADHALRAILILARAHGGAPVPADEIARTTGAPRNYLAKTLNALAKAGVVASTRGPHGGFTLAVAPEALTLVDVVGCFDEPRRHPRCLLGDAPCDPARPCAAHHGWTAIVAARRAPLATTTFADLLGRSASRNVAATGATPDPSSSRSSPHHSSIRGSTMITPRPHLPAHPVRRTLMAAALTAAALLSTATLAGCFGEAEAAGRGDPTIPVRALPEIVGEERAVLTVAPNVPAPITRDHATKVTVELETIEKTMKLADGVEYTFWTFGGQVPGNFIRVREGDLVEFTMKNAHGSTVPHNIDLHAVTGPGGGAAATLTAPGHESKFTFRALNPGLYIYHCAVSPVPMHIANGMYGLILVEPKDGLPTVDREFYVVQSEFYAKPGAAGEPHTLDMELGAAEQPTHVVFNGAVGALTGDNAPEVKVGETVRLFVGNGGPNLSSSFHVIGEVFDNVYGEGGSDVTQRNVQTTMIPAGGSAIVEFRAEKTGNLVLVDHAIFRAFNKGALGMIKVVGEDDPRIFAQLKGLPMAGH